MFDLDYRSFLKKELAHRCGVNAKYSLRAFARDLEIDPGRLSRVLNGKQGISLKKAERFSHRLALNPSETNWFVTAVTAQDSRSKIKRRAAEIKLSSSIEQSPNRTLQEDVFAVISDWYHYAILELCSLNNFVSTPKWIAKKLGISIHQAQEAIERLKRLDLATTINGKLVQKDVVLTSTHDIPSKALRDFHRQILQKTATALETQSVQERDIASLTIAVSSSDIPMIKEKIKKFRRQLNEEIERTTPATSKDEVYCFSTQLFRLTEKEKS